MESGSESETEARTAGGRAPDSDAIHSSNYNWSRLCLAALALKSLDNLNSGSKADTDSVSGRRA